MLTKRKNLMLIIIYLAGMFVIPMLVLPVIVRLRGYQLAEFLTAGNFDVSINALVMFLVYLLLCGVLLFLTREIFWQDLQKLKSGKNFLGQMLIGLICTFSAATIGSMIVTFLGATGPAVNQEMVEATLNAMPLLMVITVAFFAPIVEEIVFRLVLMNHFNVAPIWNLILSSLIFGFVHVLVGGIIHIVPYFLMGLVFGYFYLKNRNIWHVTVLHMLHNGVTTMMLFFGQQLLDM